MRKKMVGVSLALAALMAVAAVSLAAETVTLSGKVTCAKCTLKKGDAKECQDVLVVTGEQAGEYYLVKNAVAEKLGHVCRGQRAAVVTGTVEQKDGKRWLAATKIDTPAS